MMVVRGNNLHPSALQTILHRFADVAEVADELRRLAQGFVHTARIERFLHHPKPFPVDIRHNAKIGREKLAAWATAQLAKDSA